VLDLVRSRRMPCQYEHSPVGLSLVALLRGMGKQAVWDSNSDAETGRAKQFVRAPTSDVRKGQRRPTAPSSAPLVGVVDLDRRHR
jgi:hypothetical protein